jgi:hypothetical protein
MIFSFSIEVDVENQLFFSREVRFLVSASTWSWISFKGEFKQCQNFTFFYFFLFNEKLENFASNWNNPFYCFFFFFNWLISWALAFNSACLDYLFNCFVFLWDLNHLVSRWWISFLWFTKISFLRATSFQKIIMFFS